MKTNQNVMIKGTKAGLIFHFNDQCSFEDLKKELNEKLLETAHSKEEGFIPLQIQLGNRYLTNEQKEELRSIIVSKQNLVLTEIKSNVVTLEEAKMLMSHSDTTQVCRIIRSGQVLKVDGNLVLIGDVNPGASVIAGGNIFILGALKGIAHAGYHQNNDAVIVASIMKPQQLRINETFTRPPEAQAEEVHEMECAYINEEMQIQVDRLQVLANSRPDLNRF